MLLGRSAERARLQGLIARAHQGTSAALLVTGEPGIGKTALVEDAIEVAGGMPVLSAHGVQSEAELPFAALHELLHPVLHLRAELPSRQAAALEGAFALGPVPEIDRFTVYVATLSLLAAAAERGPLLAAVDDLHWTDAPSREALTFVARRLGAEGVVLILTRRPGTAPHVAAAGLTEMVLGGLDLAATHTLLSALDVAPAVVAGLHEATGGNPLALHEVAALLTPRQRGGTDPVEDPPPVGAGIERAFGHALDTLPPAARSSLLIAAVSETGAVDEIGRALAHAGLGVADLEPAELAGLITNTDGRVRFRHPLLRSVAYHAPADPDRRAAHRAVAAAVLGGQAAERRAWHRAAGTAAPDEEVAVALVDVATAARARGGPAAAAAASERAARLTPDVGERIRRLRQAAEDRLRSGHAGPARALVTEALELSPGPVLRADLQHLLGLAEERAGHPGDAAARLVAEAARIAPHDARRAAVMTMAAVQPYFASGQNATGLATAQRGWALAARAGLGPMPAGLPLGMAMLLCGNRAQARPLLQQAGAWVESAAGLDLGPVLYFGVGQAFTWLGEHDRAGQVLSTGIAQARAWSAPALLPYGLLSAADLHLRTGRWAAARAAGAEAVELAEQTGQHNDQGYALCILARIEAGQGHEDRCRAHLAAAGELIDRCGTDVLRSYIASALGFLEVGLGRPAAIPPLQELARFLDDHHGADPEILQWEPDLVEAYLRVGRRDDAERVLDTLAEAAASGGGRWATAATARCRGMLADDDQFVEWFRTALDVDDGQPFETARTRLCFGERLRRAGQRVQAREQLSAALRTFDQCGAHPWAARTAAELQAAGGRRVRRRPGPDQLLTAQELRVALTVAHGATNRDAAAALFLSPKTIEFHLRNVYRKLGIGSRTELVRRVVLGDREAPSTGEDSAASGPTPRRPP
jgi:DNA-binding CsgD family transcriptional regulator